MASASLAAVTTFMISSPLVAWIQLILYSNLPSLVAFLDWMVQVEQAADAALGIRMAAPISKAAAEGNFIVKTPTSQKRVETGWPRLNQPPGCRQTWAILRTAGG